MIDQDLFDQATVSMMRRHASEWNNLDQADQLRLIEQEYARLVYARATPDYTHPDYVDGR